MNLPEETIEAIRDSGHMPDQIVFICSTKSGHSSDLVILFADGTYLERHERDGSERWEYLGFPVLPTERKKITRLVEPGMHYATLAQLNH